VKLWCTGGGTQVLERSAFWRGMQSDAILLQRLWAARGIACTAALPHRQPGNHFTAVSPPSQLRLFEHAWCTLQNGLINKNLACGYPSMGSGTWFPGDQHS